MAKSILKLFLIFSIFFSASLIISCTQSKKKDSTNEAAVSDETSVDQNEVASTDTHVCPMHPEETGVEGDKCSKCDMPLEKKEDSESSEASEGSEDSEELENSADTEETTDE